MDVSSYARLSHMGPMNWFKDASGFDFEYSSNIQLRLIFSPLIPMFSPKANIYVCILYQPHSHMYVQ